MDEKPKCPTCGDDLQVLLFMGQQPDGYICNTCRVWLSEKDLQPLATVIQGEKPCEHHQSDL